VSRPLALIAAASASSRAHRRPWMLPPMHLSAAAAMTPCRAQVVHIYHRRSIMVVVVVVVQWQQLITMAVFTARAGGGSD
jgi:alpha/beta superfamily hydrolase